MREKREERREEREGNDRSAIYSPYLIWQEVSPHKRPDLQEINTSLSLRALQMSVLHVNAITRSQVRKRTEFTENKLFYPQNTTVLWFW